MGCANVELEKKVNKRTRELESVRWALAEKARQLQRLLSESYRVQEDIQARIAHDMHDGVTQIIIGALSDATPESIQFYFDSLAAGTIAEGAALQFTRAPGKAHCTACGNNVTIDELFTTCPSCQAYALQIISGNGVYLDSLEVQT